MISKWYRNQPIKNKIVYTYLPLCIIPIILISFIIITVFTNTIIQRTQQNVLDNCGLIKNRINELLQNGINCSNMISINMNNFFQKPNIYIDEITQIQEHKKIIGILNEVLIIYPQIDSIYFIDINNIIYSTNPADDGNTYDKNYNLIESINKSNGKSIWFEMQTRDYLVKDKSQPIVTLGKKIISLITGAEFGFIFINIKENTVAATYDNQKYQKSNKFYIIDNEGICISSTDKGMLLEQTKNSTLLQWIQEGIINEALNKVNNRNILITSIPLNDNWILVSEVPLKELIYDTKITTVYLGIILIIVCIFIIIGGNLISKFITKPISILKKQMEKIGDGDFNVHMNINSKDEIGGFADAFNTMAFKVSELLNKIQSEQQQKRQIELSLLQEQIKPHFLYNSLDCIYVLTIMNKNKTAQKMTKALADFYRVSLSNGKEIITLEEELNLAKDYLEIQKIRYGDIISYEMIIDDSILKYVVPKLTLQPVIENSIYHGIKEKGQKGKVSITGYMKSSEMIEIKINDNGQGIPYEKLNSIFEIKDNIEKKHYGLINIKERLEFYYGEKSELKIVSNEGNGTEVILTFPAKEKII